MHFLDSSAPVKVRGSIAEVSVQDVVCFSYPGVCPPEGGGVRLFPRGGGSWHGKEITQERTRERENKTERQRAPVNPGGGTARCRRVCNGPS